MPTWETATDWDNAQSESGVVHENVSNTDHNDATIVKQGYSVSSIYNSTDAVAHWPYHEDSGSTLYDFEGSNDGTISSATQGVTGVNGTTAYEFRSGNSDYVSLSTLSAINLSSAFTIMFLINPQSFPATGNNNVLNHQPSNSNRFAVSLDGNNTINFAGYDGSWLGQSEGSVSTNTWYHCLYVYDGDENGTLYLDGSTTSNPPDTSSTTSDNTGFDVGRRLDGEQYADFKIQHFVVWNTELSSTDATNLYNIINSGSLTTSSKSL